MVRDKINMLESQKTWCHRPHVASLMRPSTCHSPDAAVTATISSLFHIKYWGTSVKKTYSFSDKLQKRKTYLVRDKNKHVRKSKNLMPLSWCHLSAVVVLMSPPRYHHALATILTQLYWQHPLNTTLLIQPFPCCYHQTALIMFLSPHSHWNFIVA